MKSEAEEIKDSFKDYVLKEVPSGEKIKAFYLKPQRNTRMGSCLILFTPEGIVICGDMTPGRAAVSTFGYGLDWFASELGWDYLSSKFLDKEWVSEYAVKYCRDAARDIRRGKHDDDAYGSPLQKAWDVRGGLVENLQDLRDDLKNSDPQDVEGVACIEKQIEEIREKLKPARVIVKKIREELAVGFDELANATESWNYGVEKFAEELQELDTYACDDGVPGWGYPPREVAVLVAIQQKFAELYNAGVPVG
jgi:hypothetical protein